MNEFTNVIKYGFKNYANFSGVIDRRTFWLWYLFSVLASAIPQIIVTAISLPTSLASLNGSSSFDYSSGAIGGIVVTILSAISNLVSLALALPTLAMMVRRLRDVGTNPLVLLFALAPMALLFIGMIAGLAIGGSSGSFGYDNLVYAMLGMLLGMIPGIAAAIGFAIWMIVLWCKPTKTLLQGNRYAVV